MKKGSAAPSTAVGLRLEKAARAASARAYAPYSGFSVGAAVLAGSGKIYAGCNVENASYGLCTCAERTAIAGAVSAGERKIRAVAVYTPTAKPTAPCGACRQIIFEFGPDVSVTSVCDSAERIDTRIAALLPSAFSGKSLKRK